MSGYRRGTVPLTCVICGAGFFGYPKRSLVCGETCRRERDRRYNKRWEQEHEYDRAEYYRRYHVGHRAERNKSVLDRAKIKRLDPVIANKLRQRERFYRMRRKNDPDRVARREQEQFMRKVMREWGVDCAQAQAMIQSGTFPP